MDIKFPKEENPFPRTMAVAVFAVIVAFLIGMFLGNALGALFGTDESVINTMARNDCEKFMGTKVYLRCWVKVKENWRDSDFLLKNFGYRDQ